MKNFLLNVFITLVYVIAFICLLISFENVFSSFEEDECIRWKKESEEYKDKGYYLTDWQKEQCRRYNIYFDDKL